MDRKCKKNRLVGWVCLRNLALLGLLLFIAMLALDIWVKPDLPKLTEILLYTFITIFVIFKGIVDVYEIDLKYYS